MGRPTKHAAHRSHPYCCVKRLTLPLRGYESTVALNVQRSWEGGIERDRARVNAWHSNACAQYTCYRPARALATSSVQYSNARGREKERHTKVESRKEKESESECLHILLSGAAYKSLCFPLENRNAQGIGHVRAAWCSSRLMNRIEGPGRLPLRTVAGLT
ncbi:hypothetical protein EVAR_46390_1 [Eumeta japonica]|uniref:Uncharacterized protein n=1 Tax=Eumeta variegata TaxID=151549 RepID=A0A4C1WW06_EUMVA|nr:hypothetical protein EVAR_46390_1 [Eumeta japonica]